MYLAFHRTIHLAAVITLAHSGTLVVDLLPSSWSDDDLSESTIRDEDFYGDDGHPWALYISLELAQLLAIQQELTVTAGCVVIVRAVEILADIRTLEP